MEGNAQNGDVQTRGQAHHEPSVRLGRRPVRPGGRAGAAGGQEGRGVVSEPPEELRFMSPRDVGHRPGPPGSH